MSRYVQYWETLSKDAGDFVSDYWDMFLEKVKDGETDLHDFISYDGKLEDSMESYLDLRDSVEILEQCNNEETDTGLWEGMSEPRAIISAMAFWSLRNDLYEEVKERFETALENELEKAQEGLDYAEKELERLQNNLSNLDEEDEEDEEEISSLQDEIEELEEEIDYLEEYIDNLQSAIDEI